MAKTETETDTPSPDQALIRETLAHSPLFSDFAMEEANPVLRRCKSGQIISDTLDGIPQVGLIAQGRIEVYSIAIDGREIQMNVLGPCECFGICNLMGGQGPDTVLRCVQASTLLYIPKSVLLAHLEKNPAGALRYAKLCNEKLQFLLQRIAMLTMQSARGKVIAYLLSEKDPQQTVFLKGSREDLAMRLGISRAALFRELSALQGNQLIQTEGSRIVLKDIPQLEKLLYQTV